MKLSPLLFICVLLAMLPACRTSPPPEFHGRWHAVNRFPAETRAIPLRPDTVFAATPLDGTLKALLLRWAKESGMTLEYGIDTDYTLHAPVAQLHAGNLPEALTALGVLYATQGLVISLAGDRIVVSPAAGATAPPSGAVQ